MRVHSIIVLLLMLHSKGCSCSELQTLSSVAGMSQLVQGHTKVILFITNGPCSKWCTERSAFELTLSEIAKNVSLPVARIDGSIEGGRTASNFKVPTGEAGLRALFRNAPPAKRVLEYRGSMEKKEVQKWCEGVELWVGSDELPPGWTTESASGQAQEKAEL